MTSSRVGIKVFAVSSAVPFTLALATALQYHGITVWRYRGIVYCDYCGIAASGHWDSDALTMYNVYMCVLRCCVPWARHEYGARQPGNPWLFSILTVFEQQHDSTYSRLALELRGTRRSLLLKSTDARRKPLSNLVTLACLVCLSYALLVACHMLVLHMDVNAIFLLRIFGLGLKDLHFAI